MSFADAASCEAKDAANDMMPTSAISVHVTSGIYDIQPISLSPGWVSQAGNQYQALLDDLHSRKSAHGYVQDLCTLQMSCNAKSLCCISWWRYV